MKPTSPTAKRQNKQGFSLAETLLAMLVFSIAITTILGLLAASINTVNRIALQDEAMRLSTAVEREIRKDPFVQAYTAIRDGRLYYAFHYRAHPTDVRSEGTQAALSDAQWAALTTRVPGQDYLVLPSVRLDKTTTEFDEDAAALNGRMFAVRIRLSPTNPISNPPNNPDDYDFAVIVGHADYFAVASKNDDPLDGREPVYSYNFAIRR